jgi:hypothetical protein
MFQRADRWWQSRKRRRHRNFDIASPNPESQCGLKLLLEAIDRGGQLRNLVLDRIQDFLFSRNKRRLLIHLVEHPLRQFEHANTNMLIPRPIVLQRMIKITQGSRENLDASRNAQLVGFGNVALRRQEHHLFELSLGVEENARGHGVDVLRRFEAIFRNFDRHLDSLREQRGGKRE